MGTDRCRTAGHAGEGINRYPSRFRNTYLLVQVDMCCAVRHICRTERQFTDFTTQSEADTSYGALLQLHHVWTAATTALPCMMHVRHLLSFQCEILCEFQRTWLAVQLLEGTAQEEDGQRNVAQECNNHQHI